MNTGKIITVSVTLFLSALAVQAQDEGPGGVGTSQGLRMWLRADDASKIKVAQETVSDYNSYPSTQKTTIAWDDILPYGTNPSSTQWVVNEWYSTVGSTVYKAEPAEHTDQYRRKPVFISEHYLMNYHPAVDFYAHWIPGAGTNDGTYYKRTSSSYYTPLSTFLTTKNAAMSTSKPPNSSTFAIINAAVKTGFGTSDNQNSYFIYWYEGDVPYGTAGSTSYNKFEPAFGLRNNRGDGQPRLRVHGEADIETHAFDAGATTIAEYRLTNVPAATSGTAARILANDIRVGYNMKYVFNSSYANSDDWHMNGNGSIGGTMYLPAPRSSDPTQSSASQSSRSFKGMISEIVQYEGTLTNVQQDAINSYFAIKYGVTLRPNGGGHSVPRFDYHFSNQTQLWPGATGDTKWATFYNNLAAVIRDDDAHLKNVQAHSTDIGSIVHLGMAGETGVPQLFFDGTSSGLGQMRNDKEAVMIGNDTLIDGRIGTKRVQRESCGSFDSIFLRKWLVHKVSENDRPVRMLIGAQNNLHNALHEGVSTGVVNMYNALVSGNTVYLIVADSPDKLDPNNTNTSGNVFGDFLAVVPMRYRNGEFQCSYTFRSKETYFTFGYKPNSTGCAGEVEFRGSKNLDWNQWTRAFAGNDFNNNSAASKTVTTSLGDGISAKVTVAYPTDVRADRYYPRFTTSPRGALDLARHRGNGTSAVTATIEFIKSDNTATPLIPEFFISGLDARSRQYDEVTVTGYCGSNIILPEMNYAGNPANASYVITGANIATVKKRGSQSATAANGRVNVAFNGGVDRVVVEYTQTNRVSSIIQQHIYISPLTIKPSPPPPVINEDGLSFVKDVKRDSITTCEEVQYDFYIENVNVESKYVKFTDILPSGLKWHTLTLDSINSGEAYNSRGYNIGNHSIYIPDFEGTRTLIMDSFLIPCASTVKITATAKLEDGAVAQDKTEEFKNQALLEYILTVGGQDEPRSLPSQDRFTLADSTSFKAKWAQKQDSVTVVATTDYSAYLPNRVIEVTLKVRNNNSAPITDMYLNLDWDAAFTYVPGSYSGPSGSFVVTPDDPADPARSIAGNTDGDAGFALPHGVTTEFKFKLLAPTPASLEHEFDENGIELTDKFATLHINYEFTTEQDDPCVVQSMENDFGELRVPYSARTHLMTNKHITFKMMQK